MLTCLGDTFAGRVAASLLNPVWLSELIAKTLDEYERLAIDLATVSAKLAVIKTKLVGDRLTVPHFATWQFTRHIAAARTAMYRRRQAGLPPIESLFLTECGFAQFARVIY